MKKAISDLLLYILNTRFLNPTPCKYRFINNLTAFELETLESEERQRPGILVKTIIDEAKLFLACPIGKSGLMVIENEGFRDAGEKDYEDLQKTFNP